MKTLNDKLTNDEIQKIGIAYKWLWLNGKNVTVKNIKDRVYDRHRLKFDDAVIRREMLRRDKRVCV